MTKKKRLQEIVDDKTLDPKLDYTAAKLKRAHEECICANCGGLIEILSSKAELFMFAKVGWCSRCTALAYKEMKRVWGSIKGE
jgi:hypothetical protein